jgi:hypothetical protein
MERKPEDASGHGGRLIAYLALPNSDNAPAGFLSEARRPTIAFRHGRKLRQPQRRVGTARLTIREVNRTPVPVVAVDEHRHPTSRQDEVRRAAPD